VFNIVNLMLCGSALRHLYVREEFQRTERLATRLQLYLATCRFDGMDSKTDKKTEALQ